MAKSKYEDVKLRLSDVEQWAKDGLIDQEIAKRLGIALSTFYDYQLKHPEFSEAIKRGKAYADFEVEQSLYKRAKGYTFEEKTLEYVEGEMTVTKIVVKEVVPDVGAIAFWLKNRQPDAWRDKQDINMQGGLKFNKGGIDEMIASLKEKD